jgi:hypothetical protein
MRCNICDAPLPEPKFVEGLGKHLLGTFDPCDKCIEAIEETLASYDDRHLDKPAADEDALDGPLIEELFPHTYDPFGEG